MKARFRSISVSALVAIASFASGADLQQQVQTIASQHHGGVSLFAQDLNTGKTVAIEPDKPVTTASVIKLAILFDALEQARSGKVKFDDRITLKKTDQVGGSGLLLFMDTPLELTLKDVLTLMVVMSDNTATNLVIDHLGLKNIDDCIRWMGLRDTYLYKKVFVPATEPLPSPLREEQKQFGLGKTTAREMAKVMERIYRCQLAVPGEPAQPGDVQLCATAMTMLGNQFYRGSIPRYLDGWNAPGTGSGTAVGNKSGSLDEVRNDVALVASKSGPIVISAFTFDNKSQSWQSDNEGEITIAKLAKAIVEAWSPEGLAPNEYKPHPARF
jgi:beta-lactamase class A